MTIEPYEPAVQADVICGVMAHRCVCGEPPGHPPPHECSDKERCNGAWWGEGVTFEIHRYPGFDTEVSDDTTDTFAVLLDVLTRPFTADRGPIEYVKPPTP